MTDEDLMTRIKFIVDRLSFRIGDLTLMYEHKQVDPDDFYEEVNYIKGDFIKSIIKLIRGYEQPMVDRHERELREELVDFALEVVYQYGYVIGDGVYATGGSSVIESAFSILRRYDMLDKNGNYSITQSKTPEIEKGLEKRRND